MVSNNLCINSIAGNDTQAHLLRWYFLYMVKYPEVQKRCYEELKLVKTFLTSFSLHVSM